MRFLYHYFYWAICFSYGKPARNHNSKLNCRLIIKSLLFLMISYILWLINPFIKHLVLTNEANLFVY